MGILAGSHMWDSLTDMEHRCILNRIQHPLYHHVYIYGTTIRIALV